MQQHPGTLEPSSSDSKIVVPDDSNIEAEFLPISEWKQKRVDALNALETELGLPSPPAALLQGSGQFK